MRLSCRKIIERRNAMRKMKGADLNVPNAEKKGTFHAQPLGLMHNCADNHGFCPDPCARLCPNKKHPFSRLKHGLNGYFCFIGYSNVPLI